MIRQTLRVGVVLVAAVTTAIAISPRAGDQLRAQAASHRSVAASSSACPFALNPGPSALSHVIAATRRYLVTLGQQNGQVHYTIDGVESPSNETWPYYGYPLWRKNAIRACGKAVVNRSWIAFVHSPQLERCCSWWQARLYLARTVSGWEVWRVCNNSAC
jgi:hypothetical protein